MMIGLTLICIFIVSLLIMLLITQLIWNSTMPSVFGVKEITLLETLGLIILANIFFGAHSSTVCTNWDRFTIE